MNLQQENTILNNMDILIINDNATLQGGVEQVISNLMSFLEKHKHNVHSVGFEQNNQSNKLINQKTIVMAESKFFFLRVLGRMLIDPILLIKVRRIIKKINPDIIDIHSNYKYPFTVLLACIGYPRIKTIHDFGFLCLGIGVITKIKAEICTKGSSIYCFLNNHVSLKKFLALYLTQKIYKWVEKRNFSAFITMNKQFYGYLLNLGYRNVKYLPNTIDEEWIKIAKREDIKKIDKIRTICYIGNFGKHKGVDLLIKSLPILLRKVEVRLKIIGFDEDNDKLNITMLKKLSHQLELGNYVEFMDRLPHLLLSTVLRNSSALVLPSICTENCPLVILEAMALGVPVIASNIGGIPELVKEGKTGYLFKPGNFNDLADKLIKLFNNPSLVNEMGKYAQTLFNKYYNPKKHYSQLVKIYNDVIHIHTS